MRVLVRGAGMIGVATAYYIDELGPHFSPEPDRSRIRSTSAPVAPAGAQRERD